jgi:2-polyprenyl-6-methoxyphenol hydroxylase-like FAD-dependent oxidoreductase
MEDFFTSASAESILDALPYLHIPRASDHVANKRVVIVGGSVGGMAAAACLHAAGFTNVRVIERSEHVQTGAGISMDDASTSVLKTLGIMGNVTLQKMRYNEERHEDGTVLCRQPFPYCGVLYSELLSALSGVVPAGWVEVGRKVVQVVTSTCCEESGEESICVQCADGEEIMCDMCIGADGPRSLVRKHVCQPQDSDDDELRYAGYSAWRGTLSEEEVGASAMQALRAEYPHFGNCIYYVHGADDTATPKQSAVLYDIGGGTVNWLVYENRDAVGGGCARTTNPASAEEIARLRAEARLRWGNGFGTIIERTPLPFWTDIYDLPQPLDTFARGGVALLGDSAHAITPHLGKGSNLAVQDAFVLAVSAAEAGTVAELLERYSQSRATECAETLLYSRHQGRLRNALLGDGEHHNRRRPANAAIFTHQMASAGLPTQALPAHPAFQPLWDFVEHCVPAEQRGACLTKKT